MGRGIYVCDRWKGGVKGGGFANFVTDMGPKPTSVHTLERKDGTKPYTPENCVWATRREQMLNTTRTRTFERDGVVYKASEVASQYGINPLVIITRADKGLQFSEIVSLHHVQEGYDHMVALRAKGTATILAKTHCVNGHELTGDNLVVRREGWRTCKECSRQKQRDYYHRKKAAL